MCANTTASDNVAIGFQALCTNTTGAENVAVGRNALFASATGTGGNVAVGVCAAVGITTGCFNTIIGKNAGSSTTTPEGNTFIGKAAGCNAVNGNNNTALGINAGIDAVKNMTGSDNHNIVIGNNGNTHAYIKIDWTVTSDLRDKTNIEDVPHGLNFINQITPIKYDFKTSREDDTPHGTKKYGFKAQEILALEGDNPIIIDNHDLENLKITGGHLLPVLVNAVKELTKRIKDLEDK
jgi:hypothetical protein